MTTNSAANVTPTGVSATFSLGQFLIWGEVDTSQTANYATIDDSQSASYSNIDTSQSPNYSEIEAGRDEAA